MSTQTPNYNLIKPELTDVADITATNQNWDKIDTELKNKLNTTGGKLTGSLTIDDSDGIGLVKRRVVNNVPYKALFNLRRLSNEPCPTIELTDDNDNEIRKIVLSPVDTGGPYVKENENVYHFYGEHNKPTATDVGAAPATHNHDASEVNSGTFDANRIPSLNASKIGSGTLGVARGGTGATTAQDGLDNLTIGNKVTTANIELFPGTSIGHGGYIDFHYNQAFNSTTDYTTRLVESNGKLKIHGVGNLLTTANVTAVYNTSVKFSSGKATYTNSAIKSTSICIVQLRIGTAAGASVLIGTTSGNGSVTIYSSNASESASRNVNIIIINP